MATKRNKKKFDILALLIIICIVWVIVAQLYINPKRLQNEKVGYTTAIITDFFNPSDGPRSFNFIFRVNQKDYKGSTSSYEWTGKKAGDRLVVKFLERDPEIYELVLNATPPDSTIITPEFGWEIPP